MADNRFHIDPSDFCELLNAAPDAIVVVNTDGIVGFASLKAEELFGWKSSDLIGQPIELLVPERFRGGHVAHRTRFLTRPTSRPMGSGLELFGLHKDGREIPIEISLSPLQSRNGLLIQSAIRDISERKRAEKLLKESAQNLRSAVESIPGAFALFDKDDRMILCNSTGILFFGAGRDVPVVGRTYSELLDTAIQAGVFDFGGHTAGEFRERLLSYRRNPEGPLDIRTADGHSLRLTDRRTAEGGTVLTIWDLSEDVEREMELERLREAAEAASSAKSEFLSSMSHELRTPLNAVLGFAQLLRRDKKTPLNERQAGMADHVIKGGEHLLRLIDEILDLARVESGRIAISPEPVAVPEVLEEVRSTLQPIAKRSGITIVVEASQSSPSIIADRTRFSQILMNYGSNAIKYGKSGTAVTFAIRELGPNLRVTVTDQGIGIPEDKQDKIFQPFHRAGQETGPIEGTGIGLAISKRLAEAMNGAVGFRSKRGEGSEFWVELPLQPATEKQSRTAQPSVNRPITTLGKNFVIVYIEDNPSNIAFMEGFVAQLEGVELVTAPSAEIGTELVRAHQPDVVIMDINLPGMNGLEATRILRGWPETRHIPVIGLSAAAMKRDRKLAAEAGFFRYLTKPVDVDELSAAINALMEEVTNRGAARDDRQSSDKPHPAR